MSSRARPPQTLKSNCGGFARSTSFANYACLRDSLDAAAQTEIAASFDANREAFLVADMAWFEDAASDYDLEDPAIRLRMEDIAGLDDYAFLDRVAESRPGEELLCGG